MESLVLPTLMCGIILFYFLTSDADEKPRKIEKLTQFGGNKLNIIYPSFTVNNTYSTKENTSMKPKIVLNPIKLSTFIMYDPDAIEPSWIHYLVINIPNGDISKGDEILSYKGPTPPSGTHRYIFEQLEQSNPFTVSLRRSGFNISKFRTNYNLTQIDNKKMFVSHDY